MSKRASRWLFWGLTNVIVLIFPPVIAAPLPVAHGRTHPVPSRTRCVQFIGNGDLWRKDTGLSDNPTEYLQGIQITDSRIIADVMRDIHGSGKRIKFRGSIDQGSIGICWSYSQHALPNPTQKGLIYLVGPFFMTYFRRGHSGFLMDSTNGFGQYVSPIYAAHLEASVKRVARLARRHRGRIKFFNYDRAELAAS